MKKRRLLILFGNTSTHRARQHHHKRPIRLQTPPMYRHQSLNPGQILDEFHWRSDYNSSAVPFMLLPSPPPSQTSHPSKVKDSSDPSNILTSSQSSAQLRVSNMNRERRSWGFKLIILVVRQAIASYLADGSDSGILRIQAMSSSLPHFTAPVESRRTGTNLLVSRSGRESSTGDLRGLSSGSVRSSESISSPIVADEVFRRSPVLLLDHQTGHLVLPPVQEPIFECSFNFLQCDRTFTDQGEWLEHSLTHFKDVGPPASNECPFCLQRFMAVNSAKESWKLRMLCVSSHLERGQRIRTAKPDNRLIRYLWENSLIDKVQYRNLSCRSEGQTSPYTVTESRRSRPKQRWNPQGNWQTKGQ